MAIDFGKILEKAARPARNIATGYLSAKIANTAANDAMNADIIKAAGLRFHEKTYPEWEEKEKNRKNAYNTLSQLYGADAAEYFDRENLLLGDGKDLTRVGAMFSAKGWDSPSVVQNEMKAYLAQSKSTYDSRYQSRVKNIQDREKTIMELTSGPSKIGNMTAELSIDKPETMTDAGTGTGETLPTETVMVPGEMVPGTPIKTMDTKETRTITPKTYQLSDLFKDTTTGKQSFLDLEDPVDKDRLLSEARQEFNGTYIEEGTGRLKISKEWKDEFNQGKKDGTIPKGMTDIQWARDKHFKENFLPKNDLVYKISTNDSYVAWAKISIAQLKALGQDEKAEVVKEELRKILGTNNLSDYGL